MMIITNLLSLPLLMSIEMVTCWWISLLIVRQLTIIYHWAIFILEISFGSHGLFLFFTTWLSLVIFQNLHCIFSGMFILLLLVYLPWFTAINYYLAFHKCISLINRVNQLFYGFARLRNHKMCDRSTV